MKRRYSGALPADAVRWINYRLDADFRESSRFEDIVRGYYARNVPTLETGLAEILDPTYRDKLLRVLACEKYVLLADNA